MDFNGFYTERLEAISAERATMDASSTHSSDTGNINKNNITWIGR